MRRWLPGLANLLAVLLLMQWGAGMGLCLAPRGSGPLVLCHADGPAPDGPHKAPGGVCPLCAPLPASVAAPPPSVPLPGLAPVPAGMLAWLPPPPASSHRAAAQPRGPPIPV